MYLQQYALLCKEQNSNIRGQITRAMQYITIKGCKWSLHSDNNQFEHEVIDYLDSDYYLQMLEESLYTIYRIDRQYTIDHVSKGRPAACHCHTVAIKEPP